VAVSLLGGFAIPRHGFGMILRNARAQFTASPKKPLSCWRSLVSRFPPSVDTLLPYCLDKFLRTSTACPEPVHLGKVALQAIFARWCKRKPFVCDGSFLSGQQSRL